MAKQTWTLTDVEQGVYHEDFSLTPDDVPGAAAGWWVKKRTLRGGLQDGVEVVEVYNGRMLISLLPTRGMGVWRCMRDDRTLGWRSPVRGPVHPKFVPLAEPSGLGWLDGFDELVVRCGLESNGAPEFDEQRNLKYPLHGRIANRPAHQVEVSFDPQRGEIAVTGVVEETRFHFHKLRLTATLRTTLGASSFAIHDEVENFAAVPGEMQLLYHINIGEPLLQPGSTLVAPVQECVPRDAAATGAWSTYGPHAPGSAEQAFFMRLLGKNDGQTQVLLKNATASEACALRFNRQQLPCFTQWKNTAGAADGYVTGLEPATNFPNARSYEARQGRVLALQPGQKRTFELQLAWLREAGEIEAAEQEIERLQQQAAPTIHPTPQRGWTAAAE